MLEPPNKPVVFVSHDTRDAAIAEAFCALLRSASAGTVIGFRSSDRKNGVQFGEEWYQKIMRKLADASDVVALLTPTSIDRPWILFEAGVAKSRMDSNVFGIALGISVEAASTGPFLLFQNCDDDESALTTLTIQLIKNYIHHADPVEDDVRKHVIVFREKVNKVLQNRGELPRSRAPGESIQLLETKVGALEVSCEDLIKFAKRFGPLLEHLTNSHLEKPKEESTLPNE
jgi:hypothetical protein